jgi:ferredoxin
VSDSSLPIEIDGQKCSLCEVCVRRCPTGALTVERTAHRLELWLEPSLCVGCPQDGGCEPCCPEGAIERMSGDRVSAGAGRVVVAHSEMLDCTICGASFVPQSKLDAISRKRRHQGTTVRDLCPVCRRTQLVVGFIEQRRAPGSKAAYRSTREILRRAGYVEGKRKPRRSGA